MKKFVAVCLMALMVLSLSVTAFAATGGFDESPVGSLAPTIISYEALSEDCEGILVITPYAEKDTLPDNFKEMIEKAYDKIAGSSDLTELNGDLDSLAESLGIDGENLAVSDLFNVHVDGCDIHDDHVGFDIVLEDDSLDKFVGLMYMNANGEWVLVKDAKVTNNNKHLEFNADPCGPFAIVINKNATVNPPVSGSDDPGVIPPVSGSDVPGVTPEAPQTGDNSIALVVAVMAVSVIAVACLSKRSGQGN